MVLEVAAVPSPASSLFLNRIRNLRGRIEVPVEPMYTIHARFKHIQGVPARDGAVPLFKLRILDNLIDHLLSLGEKVAGMADIASLPEKEMEPLMASLEQRLRQHVLQRTPMFGGLFPETGIIIDLAA